MKSRPILFSGPMVRALLDGSKTQTRRVVKPQFAHDAIPCEMGATNEHGHQITGHSGMWWCEADCNQEKAVRCPYGQAGDQLWVRETWARTVVGAGTAMVVYREGDNRTDYGGPWKPGIHMFQRDSRITLEIKGVRVERLQDISKADAIAEGCTQNHNGYYWGGPHPVSGLKQMATAKSAYQDLWESINSPGSWNSNPWVWVIEFKRVAP